jgi:dinuclear metal center YbgI/SA1388 family protein
MRTVHEIEQALYEMAPRELAFGWDNVGQLLGDPNQKVEKILVALDITEAVADEAIGKGCQLIVAHHPVMNCKWLPVQTLREDTPQGHLLRRLVQTDTAAICMYTNLDAAQGGVNDVLAEALQVIDPGPMDEESLIGRWGCLTEEQTLGQFAAAVCKALNANGIRYADAGRPVRCVAVGGGACADFVQQALSHGCDTFVTSDVSYHEFLDAPAMGINLIDAGHFPTEDLICGVLATKLRGRFPELTVKKSASHKEVIQYYVKGE